MYVRFRFIWQIVLNYRNNFISAMPRDGISMVIVLKRRIMNEILTTYLPSVLILIIVYITNYFKPFFFEAVVTVNLTSLLVLTTLFISVSGLWLGKFQLTTMNKDADVVFLDSLPPTAYVKLIDIWLIFSQVIPFFEVI